MRITTHVDDAFRALCELHGRSMLVQAKLILSAWARDDDVRKAVSVSEDTRVTSTMAPKTPVQATPARLCGRCHGLGKLENGISCYVCAGTGKVNQ